MEIVDQIRQVADIVEIASQYTTLRQRGRKHVGLCPFHAEKTPSFTVDGEKQLFHCFGCGIGGDVFSLVMEKENLNFPEALKFLADKYKIPLPEQKKLSPQALKLEDQLLKINESSLAFFKKNLHTSEEGKAALEYLKKRNISEKTIQDFKLGYALNSWNSLLSYFKAKGVAIGLLEKAGLVLPGKKQDEYYDRFRGRIIFPIFTLTGKVVGFGGRTFINADPKYLNSPDTPVYSKGQLLYGLNLSKEAIRNAGELIIVEGYTDLLALYQAGMTNCAASLGTALTPNQAHLARRFTSKLTLNYDGDTAGRFATSRAIPLLFEEDFEVKILVLPDNLDPDSYIKKKGISEYKNLLKKGKPLIDFLIEHFSPKDMKGTPEEKVQIVNSILKITLINRDTLKGSEYIKQLCEKMRLDEDILRMSLKIGFKEAKKENKETLFPAEKRLLQIIIENKELRPDIFSEMQEDDIRGLKSEPVFRIIMDSFRKDKDLQIHEWQKELGPSLSRFLSEARLEKGPPATIDEALDCLCALKIIGKQNELKKIQAEISRLEKKGEKDKVRLLLSQKQDLTKQIMALK